MNKVLFSLMLPQTTVYVTCKSVLLISFSGHNKEMSEVCDLLLTGLILRMISWMCCLKDVHIFYCHVQMCPQVCRFIQQQCPL